MKFWDILRTSSSNLWRNKGRTFLTVIAIFIGAFNLAMTSGLNAGINDYIDRQLSNFGSSNRLIVRPKAENNLGLSGVQEYKEGATGKDSQTGFKYLSNEDLDKISKTQGIKSAEFVKSATVDFIQIGDSKKFTTSPQMILDDVNLDFAVGQNPRNSQEIVIAQDYIEAFGLGSNEKAIGKILKIQAPDLATREKKIFEAKIVGVLNKSLLQNGVILFTPELRNEIYDFNTKNIPENTLKYYNAFAILEDNLTNDEQIEEVKNRLNRHGFTAQTLQEQVSSLKDIINAITGALNIFGAIALIAASFGVINTLYMSVRERTREIGLMKSMGLSNGKIFALFSVEAILIGLLGSVFGILIASGAGSALNNFASESFLKGLEGFELTKFTFKNNLMILSIVGIITFLAGTLPSRAASKKDPIEALRYE